MTAAGVKVDLGNDSCAPFLGQDGFTNLSQTRWFAKVTFALPCPPALRLDMESPSAAGSEMLGPNQKLHAQFRVADFQSLSLPL